MAMTYKFLFNTFKSQKAFTLVEIIMVLVLVSIISVMSIREFSGTLEEAQFEDTLSEMKQIRDAMVGKLDLVSGGSRSNFGFLGDIGRIPTNLEGISALVTKPGALANWSLDSTTRLGSGWNGPYLTGGDSGVDYTTDAWGTAYVYDATASPPTIISRGADTAAGGTGYDQDITITLPDEKRVGDLHGFISNASIPFDNDAEVDLNYVSGGAVTTSLVTLTVGDNGHFEFTSVPYGKVSVIIYENSKAAPVATVGPILVTMDKPNVLVPSEQTDINP
jgi:prepilin-type N-terminal cleavage/methylation domain-containing protein